jgi:cbb3-type cytochrome oxidase subunit 3
MSSVSCVAVNAAQFESALHGDSPFVDVETRTDLRFSPTLEFLFESGTILFRVCLYPVAWFDYLANKRGVDEARRVARAFAERLRAAILVAKATNWTPASQSLTSVRARCQFGDNCTAKRNIRWPRDRVPRAMHIVLDYNAMVALAKKWPVLAHRTHAPDGELCRAECE